MSPTGSGGQRIAVVPGDGIGHDVLEVARSVLDTAAATYDLSLEYETFDWSCQRYAETGAMIPDDGVQTMSTFDAVLLGAVG